MHLRRVSVNLNGHGRSQSAACGRLYDDDVLAWFKQQVHKAGGGNYQTLINSALQQYIQQARAPLEETLRRVIREELEHAS